MWAVKENCGKGHTQKRLKLCDQGSVSGRLQAAPHPHTNLSTAAVPVPLPSVGRSGVASTGLWAAVGRRQCAMNRRPRCTDSERCLKLDSAWRPAKSPMFTILLGWRKGFWLTLELSWQGETGWFFFGGGDVLDQSLCAFFSCTDYCSCIIFSSWIYVVIVRTNFK